MLVFVNIKMTIPANSTTTAVKLPLLCIIKQAADLTIVSSKFNPTVFTVGSDLWLENEISQSVCLRVVSEEIHLYTTVVNLYSPTGIVL